MHIHVLYDETVPRKSKKAAWSSSKFHVTATKVTENIQRKLPVRSFHAIRPLPLELRNQERHGISNMRYFYGHNANNVYEKASKTNFTLSSSQLI